MRIKPIKAMISHHLDGSVVVIVKNNMAGKRNRWDVFRCFVSGRARKIGNELNLGLAKKVAIRPSRLDFKAVK